MVVSQPGILAPIPGLARHLLFHRVPDTRPRGGLEALARDPDFERRVVGLGASLVRELEGTVPGLRTFPVVQEGAVAVPSTPGDLWLWLRGDDRGELVHRTHAYEDMLDPAFELVDVIDCFEHAGGRDLTGYVDGTENPRGDAAEAAASVTGRGEGLDGSSFAAVQQWVHDLAGFRAHGRKACDAMIGRRQRDDVELEDAPATAHVKRTAQESFDPPAFVVRRSMPWADADREGLMFVAFGHGFDAFERLLSRMVGADDGIVDALFRFTRPVSGAYFWCPPLHDGRLDLRALRR